MTTQIPLIDLVAQYRAIKQEVDSAIQAVLESGHFILGPNVASFEREVASYLGRQYAVGVASGTDALILALHACGIGPGDEVIVPAYTFFATAEAVSRIGATPVFADIDPRTYCLDVTKLRAAISPRCKAIIPVHLYGHPADMESLLEIAKEYGLRVIEDNAQAMGATYNGRKTGSIGDCGCLSFFPSKNLGGYGDGGMIVSDDPVLAEEIGKLRTHGWQKKYYPEMVGYNSRLDELQAAVLRVKLRYLDAWNERRRRVATLYQSLLPENLIGLPYEAPGCSHVYHLFVIRVSDRATVQERLRSFGVASAVYYPSPLHRLEPYRSLGYRPGDFPEAERAAEETLAIPLYPEMTEKDIELVVSAVSKAVTDVISA